MNADRVRAAKIGQEAGRNRGREVLGVGECGRDEKFAVGLAGAGKEVRVKHDLCVVGKIRAGDDDYHAVWRVHRGAGWADARDRGKSGKDAECEGIAVGGADRDRNLSSSAGSKQIGWKRSGQ